VNFAEVQLENDNKNYMDFLQGRRD